MHFFNLMHMLLNEVNMFYMFGVIDFIWVYFPPKNTFACTNLLLPTSLVASSSLSSSERGANGVSFVVFLCKNSFFLICICPSGCVACEVLELFWNDTRKKFCKKINKRSDGIVNFSNFYKVARIQISNFQTYLGNLKATTLSEGKNKRRNKRTRK